MQVLPGIPVGLKLVKDPWSRKKIQIYDYYFALQKKNGEVQVEVPH